ncbi:MAG TPA: flagellar basal body rod protein FlgC [Alphaproteobacteria bacterium]|nr:flagellar basal body rod protein FlgC [Alphaproteobacteria bacterium]
MDLTKTLKISAAGMQAQNARMRTIAENLANADSLAEAPGADPYRRKMLTFKNALDRATGTQLVRPDRVVRDQSEFQKRYDPNHPGADADGYVLAPNVNSLIEVMDMRQAQRSYEANLSVIEVAKTMLLRTIDILRG